MKVPFCKCARTCISCRKRDEKGTFLRVIFDKEKHEAFIDSTGKAPGRGAYICQDIECVKAAEKKKSFNRAFKEPAGSGIYEQLKEVMNGQNS